VVPNAHGLNFDARGIGLAEMAQAVRDARAPRASGQLGLHLCEVMQGMMDSPSLGRFIDINSRCTQPSILPQSSIEGLDVDLGVSE
jgi:hypothetical protein